ncbi:MAG: glycosyltransferase [Bacteroidetes bacterium]|nr:glycosyltransferase [Bacteroidota bacterium]
MNPRVTVLMPAYNAEKYIKEAVRSVLEQSFTDFELLVVDDGSSDDTASVVEAFADERIRLVRQGRTGISPALNKGLELALGEFVCRFDADDVCLPHRLQLQVAFLDAHPGHLVVGSDAEYMAEDGEHLFRFRCAGYSHEEIVGGIYRHCPFIHSAVMYRKEAIRMAGGYSLLAHTFEDYLLWIRLVRIGKCANLDEPLIRVRINPASTTIDERWRGRRFNGLKRQVIRRGFITEKESEELLAIIRRQETKKIKQGAYHALCGKKFLHENYRPAKARWHVTRAISAHPLRLDNYAMFAVSFLPPGVIRWLYRKKKEIGYE